MGLCCTPGVGQNTAQCMFRSRLGVLMLWLLPSRFFRFHCFYLANPLWTESGLSHSGHLDFEWWSGQPPCALIIVTSAVDWALTANWLQWTADIPSRGWPGAPCGSRCILHRDDDDDVLFPRSTAAFSAATSPWSSVAQRWGGGGKWAGSPRQCRRCLEWKRGRGRYAACLIFHKIMRRAGNYRFYHRDRSGQQAPACRVPSLMNRGDDSRPPLSPPSPRLLFISSSCYQSAGQPGCRAGAPVIAY